MNINLHKIFIMMLFLLAAQFASNASAAPTAVLDGGKIIGVDGLEFDSEVWNVRFRTEMFAEIFGSTDPPDLREPAFWGNPTKAESAAQNLKDFFESPYVLPGDIIQPITTTQYLDIDTPFRLLPDNNRIVDSFTVWENIPGTPSAWNLENLVVGKFSTIHLWALWDQADPPTIPAPGAILLGGIGVGIVGWLRRRRAL